MMNTLKNLNSSYFIFFLLIIFTWSPFLFSQNIQEEKIDSLINVLTPSHSIQKDYKNIEIIGFDILDEDKDRLKSRRFFQEDVFYIVLYFKKKMVSGSGPSVQAFPECRAVFEYQKGGYFWSRNTFYNFNKNKFNLSAKEWQIGGIYKIAFNFKIPAYAIPGKYRLNLNKENDPHPRRGELLSFDNIIINIKTKKGENLVDQNLSLDGCLLDPARIINDKIRFSWAGSVKFYINEDLRDYEKIIISGKGSIYEGSFSLLKISTEHEKIGEVTLSTKWKQYEFELKLKKESHILNVQRFKGGGMTIKLIKLCK